MVKAYRTRLQRFYEKYNPEKLNEIDETLDKWKGKEKKLFNALHKKYKGKKRKDKKKKGRKSRDEETEEEAGIRRREEKEKEREKRKKQRQQERGNKDFYDEKWEKEHASKDTKYFDEVCFVYFCFVFTFIWSFYFIFIFFFFLQRKGRKNKK